MSSGLDDYGLFTLNFDDERYLPFEGTGAISSWVLSFPRHTSEHQQEVFDSLTDIILQVRYLAMDGGKVLAAQVEPLVQFVEEQEQDSRPASTTLTETAGKFVVLDPAGSNLEMIGGDGVASDTEITNNVGTRGHLFH